MSFSPIGRDGDESRETSTWLSSAGSGWGASGYTAADLAEHIRTEFSTFRWLFAPILAAAGFEILSADFRGSVYGTYTCRKRRPS
jgi:hypothetical protein